MLILDPDGKERWRLEGYLPKTEFRANLEMGLARAAMMKKNWADAEKRFAEIIERYPDSKYAPEAVYWRGVSRYSASHDGGELANVAKTFSEKYKDSVWAQKAVPWSSH